MPAWGAAQIENDGGSASWCRAHFLQCAPSMEDRRNVEGAGGRGAQIAGPRRVRRKIVPQVVAADASFDLPTLPNVRTLPALDYDEPTVKLLAIDAAAVSSALEGTRPGRVQRGRGVRLFAVGVALGAIAVSLTRGGDGTDSFHLVRAWGASALRSFEHRLPPPSETPATAAAAKLPKPCLLTNEDCAALMAPYLAPPPLATTPTAVATPDVPTIDVNELPMVQDPPPPPARRVRVARAAPSRKTTLADSTSSDDDDALMDVAPPTLAHPEDALDPPAKSSSPSAKPPPLFDMPSGADTGGPVAAATPVKS
jgi:hypothetical protein